MSTGGIFKLLTNTGVQDKLLMANDYLNQRLKNIKITDSSLTIDGTLPINESWIPFINDIEKTHIMFINGSYKPFVAAGFEYNKISSNGAPKFGGNLRFVLPIFGDYINDTVLYIRLSEMRPLSQLDKVRYVSLLGHRICQKISFSINNVLLDTYTSDDYNAFFQFQVPPGKQIGWLRDMGQEIPNNAYITADPDKDSYKELRLICDGNQTFKQYQNPVELWIPLLFWFKDIRNSLPNMSIAYGQTNIDILLSDIDSICTSLDGGGGGAFEPPKIITTELYMNNIFMNVEITNILVKRFGFSLIRVHGRHSELITNNSDSILLNQLKWPTETLYTCFQPIVNLTMSQYWHNVSALSINKVKLPVAVQNQTLAIFGNVGSATPKTATLLGILSPFDNFYTSYMLYITGGTTYNYNNESLNEYNISSYIGATQTIVIDGSWFNDVTPDSTTTYKLVPYQLAINNAIYYNQIPSIDTLGIKAHGISIYSNISESFYNSYTPYRFGANFNTPSDRGWYMLNFNFLPGDHQPSGHINLSRAREFYMEYTSSYINTQNKTRLIVLSDAINFLLVSNGSAILRYST